MPIFVHCNSGVHRAPTMLAALGISDPALGISDPWLPYCLCFAYVFVKGCGSLGLCFSLFLLPISEEETIKRRRPIVQFMEEPKKSQFLGCRHLEDKLVFLFADTLKTSWYSLLFISVWLCPNLRFLSLVKGVREDELDCWQFDEVVYSWRGPWL